MIAFENVCKRFGEHTVLENFSFSLGAGEQLCLVGPSGRGESTVLNLAAGLMEPDAGRILCQADRICYLFQEDRLLPWLSALQNVALVCPEQQARSWLDRLGLGDFLDAKPAQLSGGMARRVAIARALAFPAELYLFDEPFRGLDEQTLAQTLEVIREALAGKAALFVSHRPQELGIPTLRLA